MSRQYIAVEFKPGGRRYTYANDGEPLVVGDLIKVEARGGHQDLPVVELVGEEPPFECRPIMGRVESINPPEEN